MSISKRLRFEILRRDNHACRYCGAAAPEAKLTIDHVVPTALGGSDEPSNLVTACRECNSGKSSVAPDAELVADVAQDALRWARARAAAVERHELLLDCQRFERDTCIEFFHETWNEWKWGDGNLFPLPSTWRQSIATLVQHGYSVRETIDDHIQAAMRSPAPVDRKFAYFCGCAWKTVHEYDKTAASLLEGGEF